MKISNYFDSYLFALINKVLIKNLKFHLFPTLVPITLKKSKLQIHSVNPTYPDILKFMLIMLIRILDSLGP